MKCLLGWCDLQVLYSFAAKHTVIQPKARQLSYSHEPEYSGIESQDRPQKQCQHVPASVGSMSDVHKRLLQLTHLQADRASPVPQTSTQVCSEEQCTRLLQEQTPPPNIPKNPPA